MRSELTTQHWFGIWFDLFLNLLLFVSCVWTEIEENIRHWIQRSASEENSWKFGCYAFFLSSSAISTCSKLIDCDECRAQGDQSDVQVLLATVCHCSAHRCWTLEAAFWRFWNQLWKLINFTGHTYTHSWPIFGSGKWQQSTSHWKYLMFYKCDWAICAVSMKKVIHFTILLFVFMKYVSLLFISFL